MVENLTPSQAMDELIARTETCSCADDRLTLAHNKSNLTTCDLSLIDKILSPKNFINEVLWEIVKKAWRPSH